MKATHPVQCACGALRGAVLHSRRVNRVLCYCADCQAFAYFLGRAHEILDDNGGTEIIQIAPRKLALMTGVENLACLRLTENGLLRWYASCCHTPIGNTLATRKLSFVGLVHSCLRGDPRISLDDAFGPLRIRANTRAARGRPKPTASGVLGAVLRLTGMMLWEGISGGYRQTPFFSAESGEPVVSSRVLSEAELERVRTAVRG